MRDRLHGWPYRAHTTTVKLVRGWKVTGYMSHISKSISPTYGWFTCGRAHMAHTSNIPSSVSRTSEAGHSGRLRVMSRSWTKLSNNGLKSSSSLPPQHLSIHVWCTHMNSQLQQNRKGLDWIKWHECLLLEKGWEEGLSSSQGQFIAVDHLNINVRLQTRFMCMIRPQTGLFVGGR